MIAKIYVQKDLKHEGRWPHRFRTNPREAIFAKEWANQERLNHTLEWLLTTSQDQTIQERELTQEEATAAATIAQWLGSPVGFCWLEETLEKAGYKLDYDTSS